MGLDIDLIRIVKDRTDDLTFLPEEDNPDLANRFGHLKNSRAAHYGVGRNLVHGYYYEELSYQRNGVKRKFFQRYKTDQFLFTERELDELITYVDKEHLNSFKTEFVSRFVEGETIVWIGY